MRDTLLHAKTKHSVDAFLSNPNTNILLSGPTGSGKSHVAQYIASLVTTKNLEQLIKNDLLLTISAEKQAITIEQVRQIHAFLRLKIPGSGVIRRVIIVEQAQKMTTEAQNALLKTLEETPEATLFILTAPDKTMLLPTVVSRIQEIHVKTPVENDLLEFCNTLAPTETTAQHRKFIAMSDGRVGLLQALCTNSNHELLRYVELAKKLTTQKPYERIVELASIKERTDLELLLDALHIVCKSATRSAVGGDKRSANTWAKKQTVVLNLLDASKHQASLKLMNLHLALSL